MYAAPRGAPARADPRPSGPRGPRRDRGHADPRQRARAELGGAGPPDPRGVRGVHRGQHRLPRAVRLPVRDLRPRARQGLDPRLRRGAAAERPGRRDRRTRCARSPRSPPCAWRTSEDLLRQAPRPAPAGRQATRTAATTCSPPRSASRCSGENFIAAYTEGDNREVVATDTMKNFILRESLAYDGATLEGLLAPPRPRLPRHLPGDEGGPDERQGASASTASATSCSRASGGDHATSRGRAGRRRDPRPPQRPRGRCGCSRSPAAPSPASPATSTRRSPSASTGRCTSAWTSTGATATPSATTSTQASCARSSPPPSTTSSASRSSTWCTRWARACPGALAGAAPRSPSPPRTTRATRRARTGRASSTPTRSPPRA